MKVVSFNINGLRAHFHQLESIINMIQPDVIGLQETKIDDNIFPQQKIINYGYQVNFYGQKKYYGVATLSKEIPLSIKYGLNEKSNTIEQRRIIISTYSTAIGELTVINGYFPQGENRNNTVKFSAKKQFYQDLQSYIEQTYDDKSLLLIMGDMNIAPTDLDIGVGEHNCKHWLKIGKCAFLPEERVWIKKLLKWGLIDIYRYIYPNIKNNYSWFDYRSCGFNKNHGLRIDLLLASHKLISYIQDVGINYNIRAMDKSSDHAPVWVFFDF